jgi:SHS2 domain-containing protein
MASRVPLAPRHWFEEHTGDVQLRIVAPALPQLFVEAGMALAELISERRGQSSEQAIETVEVHAPDREALLVEWLNELIFRGETERKVYDEFRITSLSDQSLRAEIRGAAPEQLRTAVKAATFHRLEIATQAGGYSATVVLDV